MIDNQVVSNTIAPPTPEQINENKVQSQNPILPKTQQQNTPPANLAPLQTGNIALANTSQEVDVESDVKIKINDVTSISKNWISKIIGIALTFQSLFGIYKSVVFILVDYPILEQQLVAHQITQTEVNDFGIKAIMIIISTVLSMFFAMKLTFLKTSIAKNLSTTIGILLFIGNALIHDYFVALNSSQIMVDIIIAIIGKLQAVPDAAIKNTPFIEKGNGEVFEAVWYK